MLNLSIVVPVYKSENILPVLVSEIEKERVKNNWDLQLVLVDDSGNDNQVVFDVISELKKEFPYIVGIKLSRNFGQQAAIMAGFSYANGDFIAVIDDDLQDPPHIIQKLIDKLDSGYDVAYGVRGNRKESFLKVKLYSVYYRILSRISEVDLPLDAGDFCVIRRKVLEEILLFKEDKPYVRGIRSWVGFKQTGVLYDRPTRHSGGSGMTALRLLKFAMDGVISFSDIPLKLITWLGGVLLLLSFFYSFFLYFSYLIFDNEVKGFTTTVLLITFFGSLNLFFVGVVGEYISRIHKQARRRPVYIVDKELV